MNFIVDANIVFSAILNTDGKIADLLINSKDFFDFVAPDFLQTEIRKHYPRLAAISGMSLVELRESELHVTSEIRFVSLTQIRSGNWKSAYQLVSDIDEKDTSYIACTKQFRCRLWSGDKQLMKGLAKKNFTRFITTTSFTSCGKR